MIMQIRMIYLTNIKINAIDLINIQIIAPLATSTPDSLAPPSGNLNLTCLKSRDCDVIYKQIWRTWALNLTLKYY
jgi:hypothetical protein